MGGLRCLLSLVGTPPITAARVCADLLVRRRLSRWLDGCLLVGGLLGVGHGHIVPAQRVLRRAGAGRSPHLGGTCFSWQRSTAPSPLAAQALTPPPARERCRGRERR